MRREVVSEELMYFLEVKMGKVKNVEVLGMEGGKELLAVVVLEEGETWVCEIEKKENGYRLGDFRRAK